MNELPTKILIATDGSKNAAAAARRASEMARAFGAELHVVYVVPVTQPYHLFGADVESPSLYEEDMQWAQEMLDGQVRKIEESGGPVEETHLRSDGRESPSTITERARRRAHRPRRLRAGVPGRGIYPEGGVPDDQQPYITKAAEFFQRKSMFRWPRATGTSLLLINLLSLSAWGLLRPGCRRLPR